ncbi:hypothetical protein [Chromobacterium paludis]|uniref:hypothetical protein n=1 Tax=Chromobacterium paludis TaxID=2605945 RepID=UPI00143DCB63|nr:hypothetical protein [Chromobacterium paludis]
MPQVKTVCHNGQVMRAPATHVLDTALRDGTQAGFSVGEMTFDEDKETICNCRSKSGN